MFHNIFFQKTLWERARPSLLQKEKHRSAKPDISKVLFPDTGNNNC